MNCPNCDTLVRTGSDVCARCGTDIALFEKAVRQSNTLYNKGLLYANERNLSGAIDCLYRSLLINRKNIDARNLLGLVLFEMGRAGEALKEWIISYSYDSKDNLAKEYIELFRKNPRKMEKYKESLQLFNKAIAYMHQKSEDIAIIQLKRAIDNNPNYVDALNLQAFCFLVVNDKPKAMQCVDKVLSIDIGNPNALNYYAELNGRKSARDLGIKKDEVTFAPGPFSSYNKADKKSLTNSLPISEIICLLIGVVFSFAVLYILVVPAQLEERDEKYDLMVSQYSELELQLRNTIAEKDGTIKVLTDERNNLQSSLENSNSELDIQERNQKITMAMTSLAQEKYEEALLYVDGLNLNGLGDAAVEQYKNVVATSKKKLEQINFTLGEQSFNEADYVSAKSSLEQSVKFNENRADSDTIDDAYYYLGMIAEKSGDTSLAKSYYDNIVENYLDSNRLADAQTRLSALNN